MLLLLLACAGPDAPAPEAPYYPPDAPGPFLAGTAEATFAGPGSDTQPVQVWFPATEADEDLYAYDDLFSGTAREDAVPACDAARPVLVFSHGNGGVRYQSIFLAEHLATHGWVVVAPDHVGNTIFDEGGATLAELLLRRPLDVAATFDWLASTEADGLLAGCVDPADGYAVAGHSFGGYTSLVVGGATLDAAASAAWCETATDEWLCDDFAEAMTTVGVATLDRSDERAWAVASMAPAAYEVLVGGLPDIAVPTLVLGGSLDTLTPMATQVEPIYRDLAANPRALGTLEGAGHFSFSNACEMLPTFEECDPPYRPNAETHPIIATAVTAFLRNVRGDEQAAAWLPDADEATLLWEEAE